MTASRIEVVIPVRNMAGHLAACLDTLVPQLGIGDSITVVDDGSTDTSVAVARHRGVAVHRLEGGAGPYAARQAAAVRSAADVLLFVDARCRARPGLLDRHRRLLSAPGVALSCTGGEVLSGPSLAARVAAVQQRFRVDAVVGRPGRLDYYATANLGVRRPAFTAVGGFRAMRSGGDADLCWRVQLAGHGRLAADPEILMYWEPRTRLRDLAEQTYRYGGGAALLESLFPDAVHREATAAAAPPPRRGLLHGLAALVRYGVGVRHDAPATAVAAAMQLVYRAGYVAGRRRLADEPAPAPFHDELALLPVAA